MKMIIINLGKKGGDMDSVYAQLTEILQDNINLLPPKEELRVISMECFQSKFFQSAGYALIPEKYGTSDRCLFSLVYVDGKKAFVISGKFLPNNPSEISDMEHLRYDDRKITVAMYIFDGDTTTRERILVKGEREWVYTGKQGKPETLLPYLKDLLGIRVSSKSLSMQE